MSVSAQPGWTALMGLDPATYTTHGLHSTDRNYPETNCYTDIIVELVHARGFEPLAAMGFIVGMDFEGDQWTFFKPEPADLRALFAIDIHEMQPYRPLPEQIAEQLAAGRTMIVEFDSWHLPDTASTTYRREHVKSSAAMEAIDVAGERLRYFHNTSLYELEGDDYRGVFRIGDFSDDVLPPYTEIVRFDAGTPLEGDELRAAARELTRDHLARRPADDPFGRFAARLEADLPALLEGDVDLYHDYAFATVRMLGAAAEILASHADWLAGEEGSEAAAALNGIVDGSKVLSFRLARRKPFDASQTLGALAAGWATAMGALEQITG